MDCELTGARAEEIAAHADVIAEVEKFIESKAFFADEVELHVNLQPLPALLHMGKAGLALQAQGDDASGNFHRHMRLSQLLSGLVVVFGKNLRDGVGEGKFVRIGQLAQGLNFAQLLLAQLIDALFKRHCEL